MGVRVVVRGCPAWVDPDRLLGPGPWEVDHNGLTATLSRRDAADLAARLRGIGLGGRQLEVDITPPLKRRLIRAARSEDAKRRRDTSVGLHKRGALVDPESRFSLTPEDLALELGRRFAGRSVVDATCGAGGNTVGFARMGCSVVAIDRSSERVAQAQHNASLYEVDHPVQFVVADARTVLGDLQGSLCFIDPPWGMDWDRVRTTLTDLPLLHDLLPVACQRFETVCAKVPPSFDPTSTLDATPEAWFGVAPGDRQRIKFVLLTWTASRS